MGFTSTSDTWVVRSDKDVQYTTEIVQGAQDVESFGVIPTPKVVVTDLTLLSDQNLNWRLVFYTAASADDADADLDTMVALFDFAVADGFQLGGAGLFRYARSGLDFRYTPGGQQLHLGLFNLSAVAKTAGATGEFVVEVRGPLI